MAIDYLLFCWYYYCIVKCDDWWIFAYFVVCVVFLVCSCYYLYGGIYDSSKLGSQKIDLRL